MVSIGQAGLSILGVVLLNLVLVPVFGGPAPSSVVNPGSRTSLYAQSAARLLNREFQSREVSFLLLDARSGNLLASHWDNPDQPIPLGSLTKPFVAIVYGESHQFRYPEHLCKGETGGCWLPRGHGDIGLPLAIANSCNSSFRFLSARMNSAEVVSTAAGF